jgi:hypothetical protein
MFHGLKLRNKYISSFNPTVLIWTITIAARRSGSKMEHYGNLIRVIIGQGE